MENKKELFQCIPCGKTFGYRRSLNRHLKSVGHLGSHSYKCLVCNRLYSRRDNLYTHLSNKHRISKCDFSLNWNEVGVPQQLGITGSYTLPKTTPVAEIDCIVDLYGNVVQLDSRLPIKITTEEVGSMDITGMEDTLLPPRVPSFDLLATAMDLAEIPVDCKVPPYLDI